MRDISGADFKFAKTLTLDFFGSGMVDLPPGGAKRVKNSRKMQMVFFVFYGRVEVNMGTPLKSFSIGKGGQWQVPRGKLSCSSALFCISPRLASSFGSRNSPEAKWPLFTICAHPHQTLGTLFGCWCGCVNLHYLRLHLLRHVILLPLEFNARVSCRC